METILIDTNFFIDMFRFRIGFDEFDELITERYRIVTIYPVIDELKKIKNKYSKITLKMIKYKKIKVIKSEKVGADNSIKYLATKKGFVVATNDRRLRKSLKAMKIKTIYLRSRKYLVME